MPNYKKLLSSKVREDGRSQIIVRVNVSRTNRPQLKTGVWVLPDLFDAKKGGIDIPKRSKLNMPRYEEATKAKAELDDFCLKVSKIINAGEEAGLSITREWIERVMSIGFDGTTPIEELHASETSSQTSHVYKGVNSAIVTSAGELRLYDYCQGYIDSHGLVGGYASSYLNLGRMLGRFEMYQQSLVNPSFRLFPSSLTGQDLENFREFIMNEAELSEKNPVLWGKLTAKYPISANPKLVLQLPRKRSSNYAKCQLHQISCIMHWLNDTEVVNNDPFKKIEIGSSVYATPIYITTSERNAIAAFDLSKEIPGIQEARDIFVFQCLIGCRVSDLEKLTEDNINDGFLEYIPIKTRKKANQVRPRIPLCDQAKQIIARYEEFRKNDKKRRLLPFKYVSQYNEQIKRVFKLCGITRVVSVRDSKTGDIVMKSIDTIASSHMARRTFAGNVYNKVKDPNIVCKMTGHVEGSRAFTRYRKIDDEVLIDAVKAIV